MPEAAMSELRELLEHAAGHPPTKVPLDDIRRRGRTLARRRRTLAGVVITVLALIIGAALGTHHPATNTPLTPAPRPSPVVTPGSLQPGTYVARTLSPNVTFTVPETYGWRVTLATTNSLVLFNDSLSVSMSMQHWTAVYPPTGAAGATAPPAIPRPANLIAWLASRPDLKTTGKTTSTLLGGRPAHRITFTLDPHRPHSNAPAVGCTVQTECLLLAETPDNPVVAYASATTTVIAEDNPTGLVLTFGPLTTKP